MSFPFELYFLIEGRPELAARLQNLVDPDFAELLLEPLLYRRHDHDNSGWLNSSRLIQAKLLFLASLKDYTPVATDHGFAAVFGSATISASLFDRWFTIRSFELEDELESMEGQLRICLDRITSSGDARVDHWLSMLKNPTD